MGYHRYQQQDKFDIYEAWNQMIQGSDIATTTAVYIRSVPVYGYNWGIKFTHLFSALIPSFIWPEKYYYFGYSNFEGDLPTGSAAAFFVTFYESFGYVGIAIGMAYIGWICRNVYDAYITKPYDPISKVSLSLLWAFLFHGYGRHWVSIVLVNLIISFLPIWISVVFLKRVLKLKLKDYSNIGIQDK